jgi:PAT family beta-lactamase induction signal transducer AmpG
VGGLPAGTYQDAAWRVAYIAMAVSMAVGMVTVLFSKEPAHVELPPAHSLLEWLQVAVVEPFAEFIGRYRWHAVLLLALIGTYRISDIVMGIMANPFYVDMGYSKEEVATVTKLYGVIMTLVGAFLGGALVLRWGVMRVLMLGAVLSAFTNLLFAWLALHGHDVYALIGVVSADNLASGIASAAFIAYLSSLTKVQYSATQYALFSSLMLLLPKFLAGFSGLAVDAAGYAWFFTSTALLGVPVLLLVWLASRFHQAE